MWTETFSLLNLLAPDGYDLVERKEHKTLRLELEVDSLQREAERCRKSASDLLEIANKKENRAEEIKKELKELQS